MVGRSMFDIYKDDPETLVTLNRALAGESLTVETRSGEYYFDSHYGPLKDKCGAITGIVGLSTDITLRKNLDFARAVALYSEASAEEASEMKSNFLATMSHEIRTPINGVIGMASLIMDTELNAEQRSYADALRGSADILLTLINDILDLSKAEAGKIDLESINFEMDHLIGDVRKHTHVRLKEKRSQIFQINFA